MPDQATRRLTMNASSDECYAAIIDFEAYPRWARDIKETTVVERDDDGRGVAVAYRAAAMGRSTRYTLHYDYEHAPRVVAWRLVDGDIMRQLDGAYELDSLTEDGGLTEVTYRLTVDLVVPLPGFVKRRAEARIIHTALRQLKRHVENG